MHPTARNSQFFKFFFKSMVYLISIRYTDAIVSPQEFSWMRCIPCKLILIKNNLLIFIQVPGTINPHIALGTSFTSVMIYENRRFICLYYVVFIEFFMKIIIQNRQILFTETDAPIRRKPSISSTSVKKNPANTQGRR